MKKEVIFPYRCFLFDNGFRAVIHNEFSKNPGLLVVYKDQCMWSTMLYDDFKLVQRSEALKCVKRFVSELQNSPTSNFPVFSFSLLREFLACSISYPNSQYFNAEIDVTEKDSIRIKVTRLNEILAVKDFKISNTAYDKIKKAVIKTCDEIIEERKG